MTFCGWSRAFGHAAQLAALGLGQRTAERRPSDRASGRQGPLGSCPACTVLPGAADAGTLSAWSAGAYTVQQDALGELVKKCQPYLYSADFSSYV